MPKKIVKQSQKEISYKTMLKKDNINDQHLKIYFLEKEIEKYKLMAGYALAFNFMLFIIVVILLIKTMV